MPPRRACLLLAVCVTLLATYPAEAQPRVDLHGDPLPPFARARLGTSRLRHAAPVIFVGFSAKGDVLSGAADGTLRIWPGTPAGKVREFRFGHDTFGLTPLPALSANGATLAFPAGEQGIVVVDAGTGTEVRRLPKEQLDAGDTYNFGHYPLTLSDDGKLLAAYGGATNTNRAAAVWEAASGRRLVYIPEAGENTFVHASLSPDGKTMLVLDHDRADKAWLRSWELATGKVVRAVEVTKAQANNFRFFPDGKRLLVRDEEGHTFRVLDAASGKVLGQLSAEKEKVTAFALSRDGRRLCGAGEGGVRLWDLRGNKQVWQVRLPASVWTHSRLPIGVAFCPDGTAVAVSHHYAVRVLDVVTGKDLCAPSGHTAAVGGLAFAPEGRRVVTVSEDLTARLWEASTGKELRELVSPAEPQVEPRFGADMALAGPGCAFGADGRTLGAVWPGGPVGVWDAATGKRLHRPGSAKGEQCLAYSPAGGLLASAAHDGQVRLWDVGTGKETGRLTWGQPSPSEEDIPGAVGAVAFSPDGRSLAVGGLVMEEKEVRTFIRLWEVVTRARRLELSTRVDQPQYLTDFSGMARMFDGLVFSLAFSPDGKMLAAGSATSVTLWDAATGKEIRRLGGQLVSGRTLTFSPDSKLLAAGRVDGAVRVWDVATGSILRDFPAHAGPVTALAFSPDGKALASGATDTTVLVWELAEVLEEKARPAGLTGEELRALWEDLAGSDAAKAYRAVAALARAPGDAVPFLRERLRPARPVPPETVARLLDELGSEQYAARQKATRALEDLEDLAGPALREQAAGRLPLERRRRVEALLERLAGPVTSPGPLRSLRAVEALEHAGTPEARRVLERLAGGAPGARLTREARASLERLARRPAARP